MLQYERITEDGVTSYSRFYKYDDEGRIVQGELYYADGSIKTVISNYEYNDNGQLKKIVHGPISESYTYDDYGRLTSVGVNNTVLSADVVTKGYTYMDSDTRLSTRVQNEITAYNGNTSTLSYTYDSIGNIVTITDGESILVKYKYDQSNQLIREDNSRLGKTYVYSYDSAGNITKVDTYAYTTETTLGTPTGSNTYTYGDSSWGDLLTAYNGTQITYDQIGNPLSYYNGTAYTFTWENGRELSSAVKNGTTYQYKYDLSGVRTEKSAGNMKWKYVVNGTRIDKMYLLGGEEETLIYEVSFYYNANGYISSAYMVSHTGETPTSYKFIYITNLQGDVIAVTDENGVELVRYNYDAWGNFTTTYNSSADSDKKGMAYELPFRYRGYFWDMETGFYYLNSRYYDPQTKRFINADGYISTGQDLNSANMFAYCGNNPVMYVDPTGESGVLAAWVAGASWLTAVDGPLPIGDLIFVGGAIILGVATAVLENSKSQDKVEAKPDVITSTTTQDDKRIYYGAFVDDRGTLKFCTSKMTLQEAEVWVHTASSSHMFDDDVPWGVYTLRQNDARTLAHRLSPMGYNRDAVTLHYPAHNTGEYPHWHPMGYSIGGARIHCWFGRIRLV